MPFMDSLGDLRESQRLEFKASSTRFPDDVWESYSAFANTEGGEIVLGVSESRDGHFTITGVESADGLVDSFWTMLRNPQKVERDVLLSDGVRVETIGGVDVVVIEVPRAERGDKPVRVKAKGDRQLTAYIRRGTSDVRATDADLSQMDYDNAARADRRALEGFSVDALDEGTVARYRGIFAALKPASPWNADTGEDFLYHVGALSRRRDGTLCPTRAGLLAFGKEYEITNYLPHYLLDFRVERSGSTRWDDRVVSQSGDWSGNLLDFYFEVTTRLVRGIGAPFSTDETGTRHGTGDPVAEAANEAVANALIHSYYGTTSGVAVVLGEDSLVVSNPGSLLVDRDVAIAGGVTEQRNPTLMRLFSFIGVSDRAGSGVQTIFETWRRVFGEEPTLEEAHSPSGVTLRLPLPPGIASRRVGPGRRDSRLVELVRLADGGLTARDASEALGISVRVAQKRLASLSSDAGGEVKRERVGRTYVYRLR